MTQEAAPGALDPHEGSHPPWPDTHKKFRMGDHVRKVRGSQWHGRVVGWYSTELTPEGYAVESDTERGSVQIYPASALERAV
jgi:dihydrofolate reductase (trimethoprim resistance protein)